jgi:hypothetical protein
MDCYIIIKKLLHLFATYNGNQNHHSADHTEYMGLPFHKAAHLMYDTLRDVIGSLPNYTASHPKDNSLQYELAHVEYLVLISPLQLCISRWTLDYFNKGTSTVVPQVYLRDTLSNDDCFAACRIRILLLTVT